MTASFFLAIIGEVVLWGDLPVGGEGLAGFTVALMDGVKVKKGKEREGWKSSKRSEIK